MKLKADMTSAVTLFSLAGQHCKEFVFSSVLVAAKISLPLHASLGSLSQHQKTQIHSKDVCQDSPQ